MRDLLRPPSLATDFNEIDRRLRVMEYGDPHAIGQQLLKLRGELVAYIDNAIAAIGNTTGMFNATYTNDVNIENWAYTNSWGITDYIYWPVFDWTWDQTQWQLTYHNFYVHGIGNPPTTNPPPTPDQYVLSPRVTILNPADYH